MNIPVMTHVHRGTLKECAFVFLINYLAHLKIILIRRMGREWKNREEEQKSTVYAFQISGE